MFRFQIGDGVKISDIWLYENNLLEELNNNPGTHITCVLSESVLVCWSEDFVDIEVPLGCVEFLDRPMWCESCGIHWYESDPELSNKDNCIKCDLK